ncbi:DnaB-like helicase C-terminal domain-containing protein [Parvibaculum sp.]|uniref:DnaB-like helicase C-terminal domain-containing protein n=1 Tax=Parvibaculum sp. TaxID=2024848 RepID=UPI001D9D6BA7|nr:DnaB-like helicase C-terminal domain-containing protein [Parvibaculum sp.]MBX3490878.1 AAA family ATPase [Parvibaculum sp.]
MNELYTPPPHNIDAEQALLGAMLVDNRSYDRVATFLEPVHFFDALHGRIYEAAGKLITEGRTVTPVTIKHLFDDDPALREVGGATYLARLAGAASTIINAEEYGRTVHELAIRREIIQIAGEIDERARFATAADDPAAMVEEADVKLAALLVHGQSGGMEAAGMAGRRVVDGAALAYQFGRPTGLSTYLPSLDAMTGPLRAGGLFIVGGATSMGKSALAQQIVFENAQNFRVDEAGTRIEGARVLLFSNEMSADDVVARLIAQLSGVPADRISDGRFTEAEFARISDAQDAIDTLPFWIDDTRGLKIAQLRARARLARRRHKIDLVVVDHLHWVKANDPRLGREERIDQVVEEHKAMAGELGIPVIALAHLNREAMKRVNRRPQLSDFMGSSAIEKAADSVVFVHREEYYLEREEPEDGTAEYLKWQEAMSRWQGLAELIQAKGRGRKGAGKRIVRFDGAQTRFEEMAAEDQEALAL